MSNTNAAEPRGGPEAWVRKVILILSINSKWGMLVWACLCGAGAYIVAWLLRIPDVCFWQTVVVVWGLLVVLVYRERRLRTLANENKKLKTENILLKEDNLLLKQPLAMKTEQQDIEVLKELLMEAIKRPQTVNVDGDYLPGGTKNVFEEGSNPTIYNGVNEQDEKAAAGKPMDMTDEEFLDTFRNIKTSQRTKFAAALVKLHQKHLHSQTNQPKWNMAKGHMRVIARVVCKAVGIRQMWKPFERLWGVSDLKGAGDKSLKDFEQEINGLFADL